MIVMDEFSYFRNEKEYNGKRRALVRKLTRKIRKRFM